METKPLSNVSSASMILSSISFAQHDSLHSKFVSKLCHGYLKLYQDVTKRSAPRLRLMYKRCGNVLNLKFAEITDRDLVLNKKQTKVFSMRCSFLADILAIGETKKHSSFWTFNMLLKVGVCSLLLNTSYLKLN